jgi:hypothetical protein
MLSELPTLGLGMTVKVAAPAFAVAAVWPAGIAVGPANRVPGCDPLRAQGARGPGGMCFASMTLAEALWTDNRATPTAIEMTARNLFMFSSLR